MSTSPERSNFSELLSALPSYEGRVISCIDSRTGEAFLSPFIGSKLTGLTILRYQNRDVIVMTTNDKRAMVVAAERGAFIAVELHDQDPNRRGSLAFRDDISHRRLNLLSSVIVGEDVTYQDQSFIKGEVIPVDPTSEFSQLLFDKEAIIESAQPTWYTEDWMTVRLSDGRSIIIRADRNKIQGAIAVKPSGVDYMNIGSHRVDVLKLDDLSKTTLSSKFLPGSNKQ